MDWRPTPSKNEAPKQSEPKRIGLEEFAPRIQGGKNNFALTKQ
jgi:hypothetical protein